MRKICCQIILLCIISLSANCQNLLNDSLFTKMEDFANHFLYRDHDSTYIDSYAENLNLKLLAINKYNFFQGYEKPNDAYIRYRPNRQLNLGVGIAYKWFALDLAFNFGIEEKSAIKNDSFLDFQGTIFSSKQFIAASLQYYYGYQLVDFSGFSTPHTENIPREDIRTILINLQYFFALNYDRFSLKAPFILNEVQKKSAGSVLFGASFKSFTLDADSALVPYPDESLALFPINDINVLRLGLNVGYMYTFVIAKKFFITLGVIPEIGFNMGDFHSDYRSKLNNQITFGYKTMNAIGYNSKRFFAGLHSLSDSFIIRIDDNYKAIVNNGKFKAFIGYRFGGKSKKQRQIKSEN